MGNIIWPRSRVVCGFAAAFAAAILFGGCLIGQPTEADRTPNIVLIVADDLGYGHLGSYGQEKIRTPNLDRLAAQGMRFTQAYSGAAVCAPARSTLLTGTHQGHTTVRGNSGGIPLLEDDITIGDLLQEAGYVTGGFGKWGLGDIGTTGVPWKKGFDRFFGYLHQVHAHYYYPYYLWENDLKYYLKGNVRGREQYANDVIMEKAFDFVRENKDRRFFLYIPTTIPHTELLVPDDSFEEYEGQFPEPASAEDPNRPRHYAFQPHPRATFAAMITRMDGDIGRLMELLDDLDLADDTIILFTSDNGGQDGGGPDVDFFNGNGPLRGAKGQVYEGGLRVPAIVRWPGRVAAGSTSDHPWYFPDVMPTFAELAGFSVPEGIDGISFVPALLGETGEQPRETHRFMYWEQPARGGLFQAVRMGTWKAVRSADASLELYDLAQDVGETSDVADLHPDIVAEIEAYLATARTRPPEAAPEPASWAWPGPMTGYIIE